MVKRKPVHCAVCRMMRAMAFSGVGGGLGALLVYFIGGTREDELMAAVFGAAFFVLVFAAPVRKKK